MTGAVFLDRDGTLIEEVGYMNDPGCFRLYPCAGEAIRKLNEAGIPAVLVTNQSGIARGFFRVDLVQAIHARLENELSLAGARLDAIYYCPHHPEGEVEPYARDCDCRKPKPGMLIRAAADLGRLSNQRTDINYACHNRAPVGERRLN